MIDTEVKKTRKKTVTINSTVGLTNAEKINNMRAHQQIVFDALGTPDAIYKPVLHYKSDIIDEMCINLYPKELALQQDIYVEFADKAYINAEDPDRQLYKLPFDKDYKKKYRVSVPTSSGLYFYIVPSSKLIPVDRPVVGMQELNFTETEEVDAVMDISMGKMTMQDYAAIVWRKPISKKEGLNKFIIQNNTK